MSSQKTRHQKHNSYKVMNSLGDSSVHTAAPFDQVIKIEHMNKSMYYKDTNSSKVNKSTCNRYEDFRNNAIWTRCNYPKWTDV